MSHHRSRGLFLLLLLLCLGCLDCGPGLYTMVPPGVERSEADVLRTMRGAAREGCEVSDVWDDFVGLMIDCEDGRVVAGHPNGANMQLPGKPLEVLCARGLGDEERCQAKWRRIYDAGEAPCKAGETGPGCGPLKCSVSPGAGGGTSCAKALDPYSKENCPECGH